MVLKVSTPTLSNLKFRAERNSWSCKDQDSGASKITSTKTSYQRKQEASISNAVVASSATITKSIESTKAISSESKRGKFGIKEIKSEK